MLDSSRNRNGEVQVGCNNLSGLANLPVVGCITAINSGTRCSDSAIKRIGKVHDHLKVSSRFQTTTTSYDDVCIGQLGTLALYLLKANKLNVIVCGYTGIEVFDRCSYGF